MHINHTSLKTKIVIIIGVVGFFLSNNLIAQEIYPKREFRGVWITTVNNIDWPSQPGLNSYRQQEEIINILDQLESIGVNNVILQVRPSADAFYAQSNEPWSYWLTGKLGKPPKPYYQPLKFIIDEAHKRGIDVHAWLNPFRAVQDRTKARRYNNPIITEKPTWFVYYDKQILFNPGVPEVRQYINNIVANLVRNYDLDGIHFDDYFYPYPVPGKYFNDYRTFKQYNPTQIPNIDDWRRHNVNIFVESVNRTIKSIKPYIKFGISPFAIWQNSSQTPLGSETAGLSSYKTLEADSRLWIKNGWVDYVAPQVYFHIGHPKANFTCLVSWWGSNSFGRHVYVGMAAYKVGTDRKNWNQDQLTRQIEVSRLYNHTVHGQIYYNTSSFLKNPIGSTSKIKNNAYKYKALNPSMPWIHANTPAPPTNLVAIRSKNQCKLTWQQKETSTYVPIKGYVIYRFNKSDNIEINSPKNIINIVYNQDFYVDRSVQRNKEYVYVITSIDRLHNESIPKEQVHVRIE
ncbi:MAG: glycoside hydrolase family 10 protein [Solitalea-like symbiont of Tyrophagus putrescentiae]